MNRFGVSKLTEFKKIYKLALENNFIVEGVFTHFSTAGVDDEIFSKQKLKFIYKSYCKLTYIEQTFAVYTKIK